MAWSEVTLIANKKVLGVKLEVITTKGEPVVADTHIITYDPEMMSAAEFIERRGAGSGAFMGFNQAGVVGKQVGVCNFRVDLKGNGTNNWDAGLAIFMQCCGFDLTTTVLTPVSTVGAQYTCTIYLWEDGLLKQLSGCMGNVTIDWEEGMPAAANFSFQGIFAQQADVADMAMPEFAPDTTTPSLMGSGTWTLGGDAIKISKLSLDMKNELALRGNHYVITNRAPSITIDPEAQTTSATGHDFNALWIAGTTAALSLVIGTGAGHQITLGVPVFQYAEPPASGDRDGLFTYDIVGNCNVSSGNDEVSITVLAA